MPQIDQTDVPSFIDYMRGRGVVSIHTTFDPRRLRGRQRIDRSKIKAMHREFVLERPILVSREPLIIDGNHRWFYADYHRLSRIEAWQFMCDFDTCLHLAFEFPKTYEYGVVDERNGAPPSGGT